MNGRQLKRLGIDDGPTRRLAIRLIGPAMRAGFNKSNLRKHIAAIVQQPEQFIDDPHFGDLAKALLPADHPQSSSHTFRGRAEPAPYKQWGDDLDPASIQQMHHACMLPVAVKAALMPDAHVGYGLPIGGVLATDNAVIPYAVGVDIACRVKLTVLDLPVDTLDKRDDVLIDAIDKQTRFGVGSEFKGKRRDHPVMDEDPCATRLENVPFAWWRGEVQVAA
jgi:tRNA-splicing ligase RtcB